MHAGDDRTAVAWRSQTINIVPERTRLRSHEGFPTTSTPELSCGRIKSKRMRSIRKSLDRPSAAAAQR